MYQVDCVVVGAGAIGLAVARALGAAKLETLVIERNRTIGQETSSRNSEVIHAGLYYPAGSLKAKTCVRGRELLYSFCRQRGVAHQRCGKLIVATDDAQLVTLETIRQSAICNGVADIQYLNRAQAHALEPELECCGALLSPSTGILDSHEYLHALLAEAERLGVVCAFNNSVAGISLVAGGVEVKCGDGSSIRARWLINAAGLDAVPLAWRIEGFPARHIPPAFLAKGNYFMLIGRTPFQRLIYPIPQPGGLGIHLTLDLSGRARFGPDVEWVNEISYDVNPDRACAFETAIRTYWPTLPYNVLKPAYAGIRPKISGPGDAAADFCIDGPASHGVAGVVNMFGIESPGLTASLAIAEHVADIVHRA